MESISPQVVSAAKLPILNPNEFDLWKMRIEQYFLMTDYSHWEVILNGDSLAPTRVVDGVLQPVAPTTTEQKDAKTLMEEIEKRFGGNTETKKVQKTVLKKQYENFVGSNSKSFDQIHDRLQKLISQLEILRVSLSQEDINLKFLRSLPFDWRTHTLIWRNKTNLEEQSLDDLFNSLKIYKAEVKSSSSASTSTQNIAFVSSSNTDSTNESVSTAASVSAVSAKMPISSFPNVDSLSNAVIYSFFASQSSSPQLDNDELKQIDANDLEEMDLKWIMTMLTVECYNCHKKGHFARECRSSKDTRRNGAAEPQRRNVPVETTTSNALLRDNALVSLRQNLEKAEQERDDLILKYQSGNGYHAIPPPYTETFMPPKHDLVFNNAPNAVETDHPAFNVKLSPTKPYQDLSHTNRPSAPIIEDWVSDSEDESKTKTPQNVPSFVQPTEQVKSPKPSVQYVETSIPAASPKPASPKPTRNSKDKNRKECFVCKILTQSKPVPITAVRPVTTTMPKIKVTRTRHAKPIITKPNSPTRRYINLRPYPKASNSPLRVTAVKASVVNAAKGNMSYLSDFMELNSGYVAFGSNPKGHNISRKGKGDLVRGLPTKVFENDNTCVACKKGKQHRASCKTKPVSSVDQPLYRLHMDLFGPTFVKSLNKKTYCLVDTDDYSRVLVTKPHNKTPYELLHGRTPSIGFMRPFGCPVTILNTLDSLDTRPPTLDRTDFASRQQRIRLYCRGKDNEVNILKSIDEGTYKLGTFRETLAESTEGTPQFGPKRPRVYSDLKSEEKDRYNANIRATNILLQGLPKDIYTLINHYNDAKDIWDNVKMLLEGSELTKEDRES
nr:ribonuclease H-like domain-containing protein [Tanacetum cinerariifolium]